LEEIAGDFNIYPPQLPQFWIKQAGLKGTTNGHEHRKKGTHQAMVLPVLCLKRLPLQERGVG
jgi:transposase-like protein